MQNEWSGKSGMRAERCKSLRALCYTYKEIADKMGVPVGTVYVDINGRKPATPVTSGKSKAQEDKELQGATEEYGAVDSVKRMVRPRTRVVFTRDGRAIEAEVIAAYPFVVHCMDKRGTNYCPQYMDLARAMA